MKRSILAILLGVALVLIVIVGAAIYLVLNYERIFMDPAIPTKPVPYTQSVSPDGKYKCAVKQYPPISNSTYNYEFTLRNNASDSELEGKSLMWSTDSARTGELKFEWSSNDLKVTDVSYSPPFIFAIAKIENGEQHWTDLSRK